MLVNQLSKCAALVAIFLSATASPVPRAEKELLETRDAEHKLVPRIGGGGGSTSSGSSASLPAMVEVGASAAAGSVSSRSFAPSPGVPGTAEPSPTKPDNSSNDGKAPLNFYTCQTFPCSGENADFICRSAGCGVCGTNGTCTSPLELTPMPPKLLADYP